MKTSLAQLVATAALLLPAAAAYAAGHGQNLVVNGGAEEGTAGWTAIDDIPLVDAVAYGPNWVLPTQPGPLDRGLNLFVGGPGKPYAVATRLFDVGSFAGALAGGQVWMPSSAFVLPDEMQARVGEKLVGLGLLDLDGDRMSFDLRCPDGMVRHDLSALPVYAELAAHAVRADG